MLLVLEILLALILTVLVAWAAARLGHSRLGVGLAAAVLAVFFWPWLRDADWALVARVAGIALLAGAVVGLYALGLARLHAAARKRDGS